MMNIFNKETFLENNNYDIFQDHCVLEFEKISFEDMINLKSNELSHKLNECKEWEGIYIYKSYDQVLYIGKGSTIKNRLLAHLRETKLEHNNCPVFWQLFFHHFLAKGPVEVFLIRVNDEEGRVVLEKCYQQVYESIFEKIKKQFEIRLRDQGIKKVSPRIKFSSFSDTITRPYREAFEYVLQNQKDKKTA